MFVKSAVRSICVGRTCSSSVALLFILSTCRIALIDIRYRGIKGGFRGGSRGARLPPLFVRELFSFVNVCGYYLELCYLIIFSSNKHC